MKRCEEVLPEGLENMVSHIIQELEVHTVGDETGTTAKINCRVTQGGPASPTLFNIYIDTLTIQLCASVHNIERTPERLYADNVILLEDSLWELVLALRICSKWAKENSMEWSMDAAKSHILLGSTRSRRYESVPNGQTRTIWNGRWMQRKVTYCRAPPEAGTSSGCHTPNLSVGHAVFLGRGRVWRRLAGCVH